MLRSRAAASVGLRWSVVGLATVVAFLAVTTDPSDAKSRRKRSVKPRAAPAQVYSPPYAAIVVDANSGSVMHASSPDALRHPASLTKIMTLYMLFEQLESGKIRLDSELPVSARAAAMAPSKLGVRPGETIEVEDAIQALVTKSANDVAAVIAEALGGTEDDFGRMMTRKARSIGMSRTTYINASGLPDDDQVTTARDQAILGIAIQERFPKYYRYFSTLSFRYKGRPIRTHNRLVEKFEGVDGIKTGYTRASGFNLVSSIRRGNRHLVAVVLGGRSTAARDARMRSLLGEYIMTASVRRSGPVVVDAGDSAPAPAAPPQKIAMVSEVAPLVEPSRMVRAETTATVGAAPARVVPGSTAPMRPVPVKTLSVRAGVTQTASLGPVEVPVVAEQDAPITRSIAVQQPSPVSRQPGVLGVLPASAVASAKAAEATKSANTAAAPIKVTTAKPQGWIIQVGAYPDQNDAKERLSMVQSTASRLLASADPFLEQFEKGNKTYYRVRFAGLNKTSAEAACKYLKRNDVACLAIKN